MDNYKSPTEENISAAACHERAIKSLGKHETTAASIAAWRANRAAHAEKSSEDKPGRWPVLEAMREAGRAPAQMPGARKDRRIGRGR